MRREKILFEKALKTTYWYWKLTGIQIDYERPYKKINILEYVRTHKFYIGNFIWLHLGAISVVVSSWFNIMSRQEILYMIPCVSVALLGGIKSFYFLNSERTILDIINTLRTLQSIDESPGKDKVIDKFQKENLPFLNKGNILLLSVSSVGISTFCIGPLIIVGLHYSATNEMKLFLPYKIWYPFDESKIGGWLIAYIHQLWSAWLAVYFVYGADRFFFTFCTFLYNQFCSLNFDLQNIGRKSFRKTQVNDLQNIKVLLYRHRELMRCVDMLNIIYGKSTLFNVVSSSFIICLGGFNAKYIDSIIMMVPFAAVLFFGFVQIFLFCYYGDMLMRASLDSSDAIFHNPDWYKLDAASMKCCLFILMRAQKPCKINAFGFRVINLPAFSKILSTACSYFTLLNTIYSE